MFYFVMAQRDWQIIRQPKDIVKHKLFKHHKSLIEHIIQQNIKLFYSLQLPKTPDNVSKRCSRAVIVKRP